MSSKKKAGATSSTCAICCNRLAPMRFVPFSYFCTCWNVRPSASPSFSWLIPMSMRRIRRRLPTCLSMLLGLFFNEPHAPDRHRGGQRYAGQTTPCRPPTHRRNRAIGTTRIVTRLYTSATEGDENQGSQKKRRRSQSGIDVAIAREGRRREGARQASRRSRSRPRAAAPPGCGHGHRRWPRCRCWRSGPAAAPPRSTAVGPARNAGRARPYSRTSCRSSRSAAGRAARPVARLRRHDIAREDRLVADDGGDRRQARHGQQPAGSPGLEAARDRRRNAGCRAPAARVRSGRNSPNGTRCTLS